MENWKSIGNYQISDSGLVKGIRSRVLSPFVNAKGYLKIKLNIDGQKKNYFIHRLVAMAFIPNPDGLPEIDHIDGNKQNNDVTNLRWVDHSTNCLNPNTNNRFYRRMWKSLG